jgi:aspartate/methionine/tyrosine aminotransferase
MIRAIEEGHNQYPRVLGHESLVTAVADVYGKKLGRTIDPMKEVLVTQGCSGALHSYIAAFANDGDEVVMFEPLWSVY